MIKRATVLGAGSWGMAMAYIMAGNGLEVTLWEFDGAELEKLRQQRTIPTKLPDFRLPESVVLTGSLDEALQSPDLVVLAVPAQVLRGVLKDVGPTVRPSMGMLNLAKGIETTTLKRMSEVIVEEIGDRCAVATLSGPSHAEEVVRDMPTTVVVAGRPDDFVVSVQESLSGQLFRVYQGRDLIGVELGGALKNIIAIATGIAAGLGMGDNTLGALITRGLAEMTRLGTAIGAEAETFAGLSGIGDLVTTCASRHSRNRYVGEKIGRGETLAEILAGMDMVAEGVQTTRSGYALARRYGIEMPITDQVYRVLFEDKSPYDAVADLMGRRLKTEVWQ